MQDELSSHKKSIEIILNRIVKDKKELEKLLKTLYFSENIFPIKAILERIDTIETLQISDDEKKILNTLTAMYI